MARPIFCDECGNPVPRPFISKVNGRVRVQVINRVDLCDDCVFGEIKKMFKKEEEEDSLFEEVKQIILTGEESPYVK